jgi:hypothetical protein
MFQQDPKPVGYGGGGRKQPQTKHETENNPKKLLQSPSVTKTFSDNTFLIESTIQQSNVSMREPDYYTLLGGGKTPP